MALKSLTWLKNIHLSRVHRKSRDIMKVEYYHLNLTTDILNILNLFDEILIILLRGYYYNNYYVEANGKKTIGETIEYMTRLN